MRMKKTRFRAYQLGDKGSSFSYSVDGNFTLIEARLNQTNDPSICDEMNIIVRTILTPYILQVGIKIIVQTLSCQ